MDIRDIKAEDAEAYRQLRLFALKESPIAFGSDYEQEMARPLSHTLERIQSTENSDAFILGAFVESHLLGVVGMYVPEATKMRHIGTIWGMYTHPEQRGKGLGRALMLAAIEHANAIPYILQLRLTVVSKNVSAIGLYEACGFRTWGIEPRALLVNGIFYDENHMVLLLD